MTLSTVVRYSINPETKEVFVGDLFDYRDEFVIMITAINDSEGHGASGVVVASTKHYPLGYYATEWALDEFDKFTGILLLS